MEDIIFELKTYLASEDQENIIEVESRCRKEVEALRGKASSAEKL